MLAGGGIFGVSAALRTASTPRERDQAYMIGSIFVAIVASSFTFDLGAFQQTILILYIIFGLLWSNFTVSLPRARTTPRVLDAPHDSSRNGDLDCSRAVNRPSQEGPP